MVPVEFDGALVSGEFPVYEIQDERLDPHFLSTLLRSRCCKRAFREITTGHGNRRRTRIEDFEDAEIRFPAEKSEQQRVTADAMAARRDLREAEDAPKQAMLAFSDVIDHRGDEDCDVLAEEAEAEQGSPLARPRPPGSPPGGPQADQPAGADQTQVPAAALRVAQGGGPVVGQAVGVRLHAADDGRGGADGREQPITGP